MRDILKLFSSKVFYKWMISYVIILSIPTIIIGYFFYSKTSLLMDEQNIEDYRHRVENFSEIADNKLKDIKNIGGMLSETPWVKKMMDIDEKINYEFDMILLKDIKRELHNYSSLNPIIEYVSIVFPYSDCVLTKDGIDDIDFFINNTNKFPEKEYEDILSNIKKYNYFTVLNHSQVSIFGKKCNVVPVVQSLNYSVKAPRATIVTLVDTSVLMDIAEKEIQTHTQTGVNYMIVYLNGNIIESNGSEALIKELSEEWLSAEVKNSVFIKGTDHVFVIASQYAPWKYVFTVPDNVIVSKPKHIGLFILAASALAFLTGFLVATLFSVLNLQPLRKLADYVRKTSGESFNSNRINEYKVIRQSIRVIEEQKQVKDQQILKYWPLIMETKFEERMLDKKWEDTSELKTIFTNIGIEVKEKNWYSVLMFEMVNDFAAVEFDVGDADIGDGSAQVLTFIGQAVRDHGIKAITLQSRKRTIMILYSLKIDVAEEQNIERLTLLIRRQFINNQKVWISIGPVLRSLEGIAGSYQIAKKQLDNMIFTGSEGQERNLREHMDYNKVFYFYPIEVEVQIVNHLKNGDINAVGKIIKKLKDENYNQRKLSPESLRRLLVEIIETVMKVADSLNIGDDTWKDEYENILKSKTDVEMWNFIHEAVHRVCQHISLLHENLRYKLNEHIIEYVNNEYNSKRISLKEMSIRFQIPVPTLSKIFKELSGINFLDYINRKRIEKAKRLLMDTDTEIYAISENMGYESVTTFRRVFKKYAGVNPTVFRTKVNDSDIVCEKMELLN